MGLIDQGKTLSEIRKELKASPSYIKKIAEEMSKEEQIIGQQTEEWLNKYWQWKPNKKLRKRRNLRTGMRIVYVGEKGALRTPYRPDRIWR